MIAGSPAAVQLAFAARAAGWEVAAPAEAAETGSVPPLIVDLAAPEEPEAPLQGGPRALCCAAGSPPRPTRPEARSDSTSSHFSPRWP